MSKLRLLDKVTCCPDAWRYTFSDGRKLRNFSWDGLLGQVKDYAKWNEYPVPTEADVEDQLCRLLPPGWCEFEDGAPPNFFLENRIGIHDVVNGTNVLGSWMKEGMPLVEQSVAEERGKICAGCYANVTIPGCAPCVGMANLVAAVAGSTPISADPFLENKSCLYCKCASRANVWVPVEVSERGVSDEVAANMPDFCWKKQAVQQLRSSATA
jgi:hypothetical protein